MRKFLKSVGFTTPNPCVVHTNTIEIEDDLDQTTKKTNLEALFEYHENLLSSRSSLDYEIDGVVYKISSIADREALGATSRAPKWAIAYKFPTHTAITSIQKIEVQVGRTGALTPVAILDPVDIGGVVVARASLHNFQYAQKILGEGEQKIKMGESIIVGRAGDVIPQVLSRVHKISRTKNEGFSNDDSCDWISLGAPLECPSCGSEVGFDSIENLKVDPNSTGLEEIMGKVLRCNGPQLLCRPQAIGALAHAFSRPALDVNGLSEARIADLVDATVLSQPSDLFSIMNEDSKILLDENSTESKNVTEIIANLPGWGPKLVQNLENSARNVATNGVSLDRFIYSLGIRHVGVHTSKLISSAYITVSDFLDDLTHASTGDDDCFPTLSGDGDNEGIKGIGPVVISSLIDFAKNERLVKAAKDLSLEIKVFSNRREEIIVNNDTLPFEGKIIVFTGSIQGMSRNEAQNYAKDMGAKSTPASISKSTDVVVEGSKGGKKAREAKNMGIELISSSDFVLMVEKIK